VAATALSRSRTHRAPDAIAEHVRTILAQSPEHTRKDAAAHDIDAPKEDDR
jgi:hypothetical protein